MVGRYPGIHTYHTHTYIYIKKKERYLYIICIPILIGFFGFYIGFGHASDLF